ncbi:MAG: cytochrome c1 [Gammaproteobacteria bacterium]|nr:cytochrome c1 [Gammaproteobacteria bacterium]
MTGMAAGGPKVELQQANIDLNNHAAIQRGAKLFVNYCMGCHSKQYVRYKLLTEVGLSEDDIKDNLIFTDRKVGDLMTIAMPEEDAAKWFGAAPPDLTLTARIKSGGEDWIYSFLKSFYTDPSRPLGVNNTVFANVGMPHVLYELQGIQDPVYKYEAHHDGHAVASFDTEAAAAAYVAEQGEGYRMERVVERLELVKPGSMTPAEYDQVARDLATYLTYVSEPMKLERQRMGIWVMLFLAVFTVIAYFMKKEWWKDVH